MKTKEKVFEFISMISFLMMALSFILMSVNQEPEDDYGRVVIIGLSFWVPFILGIIMQIALYICYKKIKKKTKRMGFWCFFKNKTAIVFDIIFIVSIAALTVVIFLTNGIGLICYILLSVVVFSFCMHCIFNGKVYNTLFT